MNECIHYAKHNNASAIITETAFENYSMQKLCESLEFNKRDNPKWKE